MAQITMKNNSTEPLGGPNTGLGTDFGDTWNLTITNLTSMFNDLYGNSSGIATANRRGSVADLSSNVTSVSSGNTNTSQTLMSYTLPAATLSVAGCGIYVEAWGNVANNAASKSFILNVGGVNVGTGSFTGAAISWVLTGSYMKTASNAQTWIGQALAGTSGAAGAASATVKTTTDTSTDTSTIAVTLVGTDASAASNNMVANGLIVQFLP